MLARLGGATYAGRTEEWEGTGMADQTPQPPEQKPGGYGRSNWAKYLIIYLVVGGVLYFLIWLLFLRDGGLYG
jgi:hypothetical protein